MVILLGVKQGRSKDVGLLPEMTRVYEQILDLRFEEARVQLNSIKRISPDNPMVYLLENYIDFLTLFIGEREADYDRLFAHKDERIRRIRHTSKTSPYYRFTEAHIRLQWALVMLKFGHRLRAFKEISNAYYLIDKNKSAYPDFLPNRMTYGFIQAILGALPSELRWWVSWIGIEGDIEEGVRQVKSVLHATGEAKVFIPEAIGMLSFIFVNFKNDPQAAYDLVSTANLKSGPSILIRFIKAHLALKQNNAGTALNILSTTKMNNPSQLPFLYLEYMKGLAYLQSLDPRAEQYIHHFITDFKGRHYIKEAYQKLAWCDLLFHGGKRYSQIMHLCEQKGVADTDADKAALEEARKGTQPDRDLLKARLLFDGGYYQMAMNILVSAQRRLSAHPYSRMVMQYQKGRIFEKKEDIFHAIQSYRKVLGIHKYPEDYRLCNASVHLGYIYQKMGNYTLARQYFEQALALEPDQYKTSLHAKATAGLNQLEHRPRNH